MRRFRLIASLLVLTATVSVGCARTPIPPEAPRSPYERFEVLRGEKPPKTVTNSFGRQEPNLRGRLGS